LEGGQFTPEDARKSRANVTMSRETLVSDAKIKRQGKDKSDFEFAVMRGLRMKYSQFGWDLCLSEGVACCESAAVCMGGWFLLGDLYEQRENGREEVGRWAKADTLFTMGRLADCSV
jgi:hypothetical protein